MTPLLLDDISFWDVVWWMIMMFFFTMAIWIFISIVADIFRRNDISGWIKALWLLVIFILPFLGALAYIIFRPVTQQDRQMIASYQEQARRVSAYSATDEIAKAQQLLSSGAITQQEFDDLKRKALA